MKANMIKIDADKFKSSLKAGGVTAAGASRDCGFHESYFRKCIETGYMAKRSMLLLEKITGISGESYIAKEPEKQPKPVKKTMKDLTVDELRGVILEVVTKAIEEYYSHE